MSLDLLHSSSFMVCFMQMQNDLEDATLEVHILQARLDVLAKSTTKAKRRIEQIQSLNKKLYALLNLIKEQKTALLLKYSPDSIEPEEEPAEYGLVLEGVDDAPGREGNQSSPICSEDEDSSTPSTSKHRLNRNLMKKSFQSMTLNDSIENGNLSDIDEGGTLGKFFSLTKEDIARISKDFDDAHAVKLQKAFEKLVMRKIDIGQVKDLGKGTATTSSTTATSNPSLAEPITATALSSVPATKKKNKNKKSDGLEV